MKLHISAPKIKNLKAQEKPYEVVDDDLKGFLARVQPSGVITYYYSYRSKDGARKRYRIGKHPSITASIARKTAENIAAQVTQGGDPQLEKKGSRAKRAQAKHETLKGFIEHKYKDWAVTHQKRGNETLALLESSFKDLYSRKLKDITAWDMQKWRAEKDKAGLKTSTINRRVTTLKAVLNKAVEWDVIANNPLNKIKPLKLDASSRIRYLSSDEETRLRESLDKREHKIRSGRESGNNWREVRGYSKLDPVDDHFADHLKPMVILSINTGLRRGEIFNLKWTDVDFDKKLLTVEGQTAKSGQTRHVQLNSEALSVLKAWRGQTMKGFVFPSPITRGRFDNIKKSWNLLREQAGVPDFRFHDLRHTFASKLVMAGVDLYTVKELMGHSTIQMTERYAHLAPEHKASAVEKIVQ
jgi:integrase|tara:strand:+ start:25 stop:1263 length:1239 start_codon:yes stop_codon:yes gene_type:complete